MTQMERFEIQLANFRATALDDRLAMAESILREMNCERRPPRMSIPVRADDEDIVLQITIEDCMELVTTVREFLTVEPIEGMNRWVELQNKLFELVGLPNPYIEIMTEKLLQLLSGGPVKGSTLVASLGIPQYDAARLLDKAQRRGLVRADSATAEFSLTEKGREAQEQESHEKSL